MAEFDKEEHEDLVKNIQKNLGFSNEASDLLAYAASKILDAGEYFDEFKEKASVKDMESMRKTLINLLVAYLYDLSDGEVFEELVKYMFPVLDNLSDGVVFLDEEDE